MKVAMTTAGVKMLHRLKIKKFQLSQIFLFLPHTFIKVNNLTMEFMSALGSQEDAYRPSLFELVAQEKLKELLQPAVQYVLAVSQISRSFLLYFVIMDDLRFMLKDTLAYY